MTRYAAGTEVSESRSREEIERTLMRYGASEFASYRSQERGGVAFMLKGRRYQLMVPLPDPDDRRFKFTESRGYMRSAQSAREAYEQEVRRRWRVLLLKLKAAFESVDLGMETVEQALWSLVVLPSGEPIADWAMPRIEHAYRTGGDLPPLLPSGGGNGG